MQLALPDVYVYVEGTIEMGINDRALSAKEAKRAQKPAKSFEDDGWKGYVNIELNDLQRDAVKESRKDMNALWDVVWDLVDAQYKLSISYDPTHDVYNLSMTSKAAKDINAGLTLTGRGGSVHGACASFVYKHRIILEGDWRQGSIRANADKSEDFVG